jgi:hypothetical protein
MEARHEADRSALPAATQAILVAVKGISLHTLAHSRLDRAHLHPSFPAGRAASPCRARLRNGCKPAHRHRCPWLRPLFIPSSPCRSDTRLPAERIGGWTSRVTGRAPQTTQTFPDLADQARISDVVQDSDFRTEITLREKPCFSAVPPHVRCAAGDFATPDHFHLRQSNT